MKVRRFAALARSSVIFGIAALSPPVIAQGASAVTTDSAVFVERLAPDSRRQLETVDTLGKGDRVVTIVRWQRKGGTGGFTITNPLPRAIAYQSSSRRDETVSVDDGQSWGKLGELTVGRRLASPEDVTHVRWRISPQIASRGRGQIAYSGIVR